MSENKITMTIKPAENKAPQMDGMIALKKIEHYTYALSDEIGLGFSSHVYRGKNELNSTHIAIKMSQSQLKSLILKKKMSSVGSS